ncbi:MFS transporter [Robbsia andropogonis]|uniref:MFS transporter n=1 Tax=Robbsia andropogonis TaxID=28092 RepID=UPI002A69F9A7|nr:MFS transporter [Robbsia andropogonis]
MSQSATPSALRFQQALFAMIGIALVNMLVALDQTVVSTALPSIISELKGFEYYAWIANAYLLASIATVPIFGRIGDFFGRKPFVVAAVIVFTVASILCGLATNMLFLVLARALQGIGGGMMVATAFASIPDLFPDARARVRWQVVMAAAYGIGTAAGPSLGGFLTEQYGWRSTFLINLPVGAASLFCIMRFLPRVRHVHTGQVKLDIGGAVLITVALGALQMSVEAIPREGLTTYNLWLLGIVICSIAGLLWCEKRASHPIIPLDLFRNAELVRLFIMSVLAGFVMFSLLFFTPLLLQGGFGLSPQLAGLLATPQAAFIAVGSVVNTSIVIRLRRPALTLTIGFSLMLASAMGVMATQSYTPHWFLVLSVMFAGLGLGFTLNNLNIFSQNIAGKARFGIATALMQSSRMIGGMMGTTLIGVMVTHSYENGVGRRLAATLDTPLPEALAQRFRDPQLLVDPAAQQQVLDALREIGVAGRALIATSRDVLVGSVHMGMLLTAGAAFIAVLMTRKLLHITLHAKPIAVVLSTSTVTTEAHPPETMHPDNAGETPSAGSSAAPSAPAAQPAPPSPEKTAPKASDEQ